MGNDNRADNTDHPSPNPNARQAKDQLHPVKTGQIGDARIESDHQSRTDNVHPAARAAYEDQKTSQNAAKGSAAGNHDVFSSNPNIEKGSGDIQIGDEHYKVVAGQLRRVVYSFAEPTLEPHASGQLQANGNVEFFQRDGSTKVVDLSKTEAVVDLRYQDKTYNVLCSGGKQYDLNEIEKHTQSEVDSLYKSSLERVELKGDIVHGTAGKYLDYVSKTLGYQPDGQIISTGLTALNQQKDALHMAVERVRRGHMTSLDLAKTADKIGALDRNFVTLQGPMKGLIENSSNRIKSIAEIEAQVVQWGSYLRFGPVLGPIAAAVSGVAGTWNKMTNPLDAAKHVVVDAATGIVGSRLLGPSVGKESAEGVVKGLTEQLPNVLKGNAKDVFIKQVSNISMATVRDGQKLEGAVAKMVEGIGGNAANKEKMTEVLVKELQKQTAKSAEHAAIKLLKNAGAGAAANVTAEVAATLVGLQSPADLCKRLASSAVEGAEGATIFHVGAHVATAGSLKEILLVRDGMGKFYAGEGMVINPEHGEPFTVGKEPYQLKADEKIDLSAVQAKPDSRSRIVGQPEHGKELTRDTDRQSGAEGPAKSGYDKLPPEEKQQMKNAAIKEASILNRPNQLEEILKSEGEIPKIVDMNQERSLSSWLKEMLVRPTNFPGVTEAQRRDLWDLSEKLKSINVRISGNDIFAAGGESIAIKLQPGAVYDGQTLKNGAVLKLTNPKIGQAIDSSSGTHPGEAQKLAPTKFVKVGGTKFAICVQEILTPCKEVSQEELTKIQRLLEQKEDGLCKRIFWDHMRSEQFGRDKNGTLKLLDWSATVDRALWELMEGKNGQGGQY